MSLPERLSDDSAVREDALIRVIEEEGRDAMLVAVMDAPFVI